jgi:hypothetical protein
MAKKYPEEAKGAAPTAVTCTVALRTLNCTDSRSSSSAKCAPQASALPAPAQAASSTRGVSEAAAIAGPCAADRVVAMAQGRHHITLITE